MAGHNRKASKLSGDRPPLKSDGLLGGFELPEGVLPNNEEWHPVTRLWWDAFRSSPQGVQMATEVDWFFLLDTALVHHNMWKNGRWEFANEVRMRVAKFGATVADRMALKMELDVPEPFSVGESSQANVTRMDDARKKRLLAGGV